MDKSRKLLNAKETWSMSVEKESLKQRCIESVFVINPFGSRLHSAVTFPFCQRSEPTA